MFFFQLYGTLLYFGTAIQYEFGNTRSNVTKCT